MAWSNKEREALKEKFTQINKKGPNKVPSDGDIRQLEIVAERTGLDPFAGHLYGTWRGGKFQVESTIDGFFAVAESTKEYAGTTKTQWCDAEGNWFRPWLKDTHPAGVEVGVKKVVNGQIVDTEVVARWSDYVQTTKDKQGRVVPNSMWRKMGPRMLEKCAHALALRQAFPKALGGLYTREEMMQADSHETEQIIERVERARQTPSVAPQEAAGGDETPFGGETPAEAPRLPKNALDDLTGHIRLLLQGGLKVTDVCNLFGAAGIEGPGARSKKAIHERLKALTADEANKLNLTLASKVEQTLAEQAEAAKKKPEPEPGLSPEDEALAALGG